MSTTPCFNADSPVCPASTDATELLALTRTLAEDSTNDGQPIGTGTRFGRYRILCPIGHGGMGAVYLAEQTEPIQRRVAIKLMTAGKFSPEHRWRFALESQALARMSHPGIAQVLDASAGADGHLYFVMEYVAGVPLGDWLASRAPSMEARVALLRDACHAVAHAHGKGVLHCDLKPSNLLISDIDGRPSPKLIDFGIARMVGDAGSEVAGTPGYMSPEQSAGSGIDNRSDVFSLGVLLFEILSGQRYRNWSTAALPLPEARELIAQEPSTPCINLSGTGLGTAREQELSAILARALAGDREHRYATCDALADDLTRWIDLEPVQAMLGGNYYRLRCFIRRQRALSVAALLFTLVAGLLLWQLIDQLDETRRERDVAHQVTTLLLDTLRAADPYRYPGGSMTARDLLRVGAERLRTTPIERESRLRVLETLGEVQSRLELFDDAASTYETAATLADTPLIREQFRVARAQALMNAEAFDAAAALSDETIEKLRGMNAPAALADALLVRAEIAEYAEDLEEASALLTEAATLLDAVASDELRQRWQRRRGRVALAANDADAAVKWLEAAHAIALDRFGETDLRTLDTLSDLAVARAHAGDLATSEGDRRTIVASTERIWGEDSPGLAIALSNLSAILQRRGGDGPLQESALLARRAYDINLRMLGEDAMDTALAANNLANVLGQLGQHGQAEPLHAAAVRGLRVSLGDSHSYLGIALNNQARNLIQLNRGIEAGDLLERAGVILAASLGEEHPRYALWRLTRAEWLLAMSRRDAAAAEVGAAQPLISEHFPSHSPEAARLQTLLRAVAEAH